MTTTTHTAEAADGATVAARPSRQRFTAWPLWAVLAGVAGAIGTVVTDLRPDAELEAFEKGVDYIVTSADMLGLDSMTGRIGHIAGLIAIVALLVLSAAWQRHVDARPLGSTASRVVSAGLIASAAGLMLGYGWRGALANYLGAEAGLYDGEGLFVYYMLTDFGAYLPWFGALVSAGAMAWMAFVERSVSRILGTVTAIASLGLFAAVIGTGVPGLPGVLMPAGLVVAGLWLAFGRSPITQRELAR